MGLLDDAIRDHLDLKRRRGADPAEIERAEREALGPVRREPIASEEGAAEASSQAGSPATTGEETVLHPIVEEYGPGERFDEPEDEDDGDEEEWDYYDDEEEYEGDEEARPHPADSAQPHPSPPDPAPASRRPPADPEAGLGETVSYDLSDADIEHPPGEGEDVLEETPEFLQDTPEHDRLWFEQRPPKDFDFDE